MGPSAFMSLVKIVKINIEKLSMEYHMPPKCLPTYQYVYSVESEKKWMLILKEQMSAKFTVEAIAKLGWIREFNVQVQASAVESHCTFFLSQIQ